MPNFKPISTQKKAFFSIIIPVRNEGQNIINLLQDLEKQTYPKTNFEVIVADDSSTDNTLELLNEFKKRTGIKLIINELDNIEQNFSPKKRAINSSIQLANGELITTTDGDCRVGEKWLETLSNFYQQTDAALISSGVTFFDKPDFFSKIQIIEFASLVGSGACAMYAKRPNMCNGANLTYKKSVFFEVGGFAGNENLASGDDEFLMHKIAERHPEKVQFLKNPLVTVETFAHASLKSFYSQRKRWASKWKYYKNPMTIALAVFVFLANLSPILGGLLFISHIISADVILLILALKCSAEFFFLLFILKYFKKTKLFWLIPIVQLIYPFYVVFFGLVAQGNGYEWKGRKLS